MKNLMRDGMMMLAGILIMTASCTKVDDSEVIVGEGLNGTGTLALMLTDAPFPVSLVDKTLVTIDKIEIRSTIASTASSTTTNTTTTGADSEAMYNVLYSGEGKVFDLLDLQNGVTAELMNLEIPIGTYDLIRMHIVASEVVLKDGTSYDMKVPSAGVSGLKIKISPELVIEDGVESEVLLDFDVSKSFITQGNVKVAHGIKGFLFNPVLRAVCQKYSGIIAGKVSANETTPIAEANVQIYRADTVYSSALTDATGAYALIGLPAGNYELVCEKDGYAAAKIDQVTVKARETTTQNITMGTATATTNP